MFPTSKAVADPGEPEYAAFVAIDWADQRHTWAMIKTGTSQRQEGEFDATPEAVEAWVSELLAGCGGGPIALALEQKRGALLCLLSKFPGLVLYPIHPATTSRLRAALYPSGAKSDPGDAWLLLEVLLYHRRHLRVLKPDTVETRKLQFLVQDRRKLVDEKTEHLNQLRARLKLYFPQALRWLPELDSPLASDFLHRWPTLGKLQKARPQTVRDFFCQHNCRSQALQEKRLTEISQAVVATEDPAVVEAGQALVTALLDLIATLREHIAVLDRMIEETTAVHPDLPLLASFPGAGTVMAPRLVAALGTQRDRFGDARGLSQMSGIAPVQEKSGQSVWIHFRWSCPKFVRQSFHEWAGHSLAKSRWAKAYYDRQTAKGMRHHAAVRALAFKWQRILFRCWQDHRPYDEEKYIEALRRRGSPLATALEG